MKKFVFLSTILNLIVIIIIIFLVYDYKQKSATNIFQRVVNSVVELKAVDGDNESFGSAIVISGDGELITNYHVVSYKKENEAVIYSHVYVRLATEDNYYEVKVIKTDEYYDLALLKIIDVLKYNSFKKINKTTNPSFSGAACYAVGNMNSQGISISKGIISNSDINIIINNETHSYIKAEVNISTGSSGGALLNVYGELIGITTLRLKDNYGNPQYGYGYSIPNKIINSFLKD
jgi:serine protease Do